MPVTNEDTESTEFRQGPHQLISEVKVRGQFGNSESRLSPNITDSLNFPFGLSSIHRDR